MIYNDFKYKMVIAIRTDLKLSKSKMAIYTSHVAVLSIEEAKRKNSEWLKKWYQEGQKKVLVQVSSEKEIQALYQTVFNENLPCAYIRDPEQKNKTKEIIIAIAIGPSPNSKIDKFTANLRLM